MTEVDRRTALQWSTALAATLGIGACSRLPSGAPSAAIGYGKDPPLTAPVRQVWPKLLSARQRHDLAALIDIVTPGIDGSPAGSALGLIDFFDEWLGAPYPDMTADRGLILPMLETVDGLADRAQPARHRSVSGLAAGAHAAAFARFCVLAAAAYYTTAAGFTAIGFIGNEPRETFDGPPPEVLAHFDVEFAKLALGQNISDPERLK